MDETLKRLVRSRARNRCEYCARAQTFYRTPFQVEHIIALQHGRPTVPNNLALAYVHCNLHKGPNIAGLDPESGALSRLFNPPVDMWTDHFPWFGGRLLGRTAVGRTMVIVLNMNSSDYVAVRESLMREGTFPPSKESN